MTPFELNSLLSSNQDIHLLDVREPYEYKICKLNNSLHIPIGQIVDRISELSLDLKWVVLCHHGIRSAMVVNYLRKNGFPFVYNLDGGINRWALEVDPEMKKY